MCYKLNGYLAIISSQIEMDTINENLSIQKMPYWIGPSKNYSAWCDGNTKVNQRCVYLKPVLGGIVEYLFCSDTCLPNSKDM